jgi:hypothetical protein
MLAKNNENLRFTYLTAGFMPRILLENLALEGGGLSYLTALFPELGEKDVGLGGGLLERENP